MRPEVFLRSYVVVERRFGEVAAEMVADIENWVPDMARAANGNGARLLSELGFELGPGRITRRIRVEIGAPRASADLLFFPIRWRAATATGLFPVLDGELELAAIGRARTHLGLSATYEPPLGLIGRVADRALFHRVAEMTAKDFLERIAERLVPTARAPAPLAPS